MRKADKNEDNKMTLKELKHFLRQINVEVDDTYAEDIFKVSSKQTTSLQKRPAPANRQLAFRSLFQKCDTSNSGSLEGSEIKHFYDLLTQREEIDVIYGKYAETDGQMSSRDLLNFLLNEQREEEATMEDALKLINKYEVDAAGRNGRRRRWIVAGRSSFTSILTSIFPSLPAKQKKHLTKDGFLMYLHQDEGSILKPAHSVVYQDMTQPLNHYYISSSHNTYLMEDQLKGPSSTEAYIK